jgi:hypothetical protein
MSLKILTGFPGSCPHGKGGVKQDKTGTFILFPSYRPGKGEKLSEEAKGAGSRFWTKIENTGTRPVAVRIVADWETEQRTQFHDIGHIRAPGGEWEMIPAVRTGCRAEYSFKVEPGVTDLALYPEYNSEDCLCYLQALPKTGAKVEVIGKSREKRLLHLITIPSPTRDAKTFFLQARDHAYESAGSYGVEGIVNFLLSGDALANYLRNKFTVQIIPMTNPDGVDNGMSRLSWERGADLNRVYTVKDSAHETLRRAIDKARPLVHMNIHNWTNHFVDGLLANDPDIAERIQTHLPADHARHKRWYVQTHYDYLRESKLLVCPESAKSWKNYCQEKFGATGVNFEFPWFMRTPDDMREQARKAFFALALTVIELNKL